MQTGNLLNLLAAQGRYPAPTVGDGATMLHWTDRDAGTVIFVSADGKRLVFQEDAATRTDTNGMSDVQSYSYARDPSGATFEFTLRKNGRWVLKGEDMKTGRVLRIGSRETYFNFGF